MDSRMLLLLLPGLIPADFRFQELNRDQRTLPLEFETGIPLKRRQETQMTAARKWSNTLG